MMKFKILLIGIVSFTYFQALASYEAKLSIYFPNPAYNTQSLNDQCQGQLISKVYMKKPYTAFAAVGVCKTKANEASLKDKGIYYYHPIIEMQFPNSDHDTRDLRSQCDDLGGELSGKVEEYKQPYSIRVLGAVCKIQIK